MVLASNVDELNFLAARLETLSAGERAELNAALQAPQSELFSIGRITDFPENVDYYVHLPEVHGPAQLGDYYLNRSGMVDMPEEWKGGIDTAQFGRYVAQQEQGVFTQYGYLVKSGDEWQKVHEGQPVPEEYRVLSFPSPEILRDAANITTPIQSEPQPQKVLPIILNGKDSAERMKEITDRLETGIQQLFDSDRYKAYLTTMAKFHNYSFNNTLLIAMQGGQLVAGFNKWKDTFHRTVKKGEKGIKILAPAPYKVKQKMEKLDEQGKPILDKDGKPLTEEKTVQIPAFKVVSVFDVSQTEGEPLPSIAVDELSGSVQDYTAYYQSDFAYDIKMLRESARSDQPEDKLLLWLSRPSGTFCFRERDVLLKDTQAYNTWKFCGEQTHDRILAYAVELTGTANGTLQGNLYELDYQQHFQHIRDAALPVGSNRLIYESGMREIGLKEHFDSRSDKYFGEFVRYEMQPRDPELLQAAIRQEQRSRESAQPGDFKEHLAALHTGLIEAEAQRIAADMKWLAAPNSPDKNHFMVEVSPYFTKLASSRDTDQLLAMLPYKSMHLSSVKDRFGIYALVDKKENRDRGIRKPRASVRKQLSETKQAASPKKAAARSKQHEMKV